MLIKLRNFLMKVFGNIKISKYPPFIYYKPSGYKVKGGDAAYLWSIIKPGDVLLRGYDEYISSRLIGHWSHVGLVINDNQVIHAIGKGVTIDNILDFFRADRVVILRPNLPESSIEEVISKSKKLEGMPYDFAFDFVDHDEFSCSELVFHCFEEFRSKLGMFRKIIRVLFLKREVVSPEDFLDYPGFTKIDIRP